MLEPHERRAILYRLTLDAIDWEESEHSRDERGRFLGGDGNISPMKKRISGFVPGALAVADRKVEISLGRVTNHERIKADTGFDLEGFERILDNYGVRHTMKKHGNPKAEAARGQIAVTLDDFALIPLITAEPDRVFHDGQNKIGRDVIVFCKAIDGIGYRHVEEIRPKGKLVATDSLRKKKGAWGS